jgi:hypothetical protein
VAFIALGSAGTPDSSSTALGGQYAQSKALTDASMGSASTASQVLEYYGTFTNTDCSTDAAGGSILNMGLFGSASNDLMFGGTFTDGVFTKQTNQDLNVTYTLSFT